jgi:hypothetical protein
VSPREEHLRRFEKGLPGEGFAFETERAGCFVSHWHLRTVKKLIKQLRRSLLQKRIGVALVANGCALAVAGVHNRYIRKLQQLVSQGIHDLVIRSAP